MNILTFILIIMISIVSMFAITLVLIIIDSLFLDSTIQNIFSNILNKIFNKGDDKND